MGEAGMKRRRAPAVALRTCPFPLLLALRSPWPTAYLLLAVAGASMTAVSQAALVGAPGLAGQRLIDSAYDDMHAATLASALASYMTAWFPGWLRCPHPRCHRVCLPARMAATASQQCKHAVTWFAVRIEGIVETVSSMSLWMSALSALIQRTSI